MVLQAQRSLAIPLRKEVHHIHLQARQTNHRFWRFLLQRENAGRLEFQLILRKLTIKDQVLHRYLRLSECTCD
uniref:Uncharacterized protein n=1 Tax=Brassica oleracea TaxID=3712 RepID=A0A3P6EG73_BRAOL|nr:unnamed protein product [Brassica oleracea]